MAVVLMCPASGSLPLFRAMVRVRTSETSFDRFPL